MYIYINIYSDNFLMFRNTFLLQTITFNLGGSVVHTSDNLVTKEDEIELFVEGYISNNGDGFINQVSMHYKYYSELLSSYADCL